MEIFYGIAIPFLGTALGAACVFFMKKALSDRVQRALTGFAAGVMVAASVWSLLIPGHGAVRRDGKMGLRSGGGGLLDRHSVFAAAGSHHPPSAPEQQPGRGAAEPV